MPIGISNNNILRKQLGLLRRRSGKNYAEFNDSIHFKKLLQNDGNYEFSHFTN